MSSISAFAFNFLHVVSMHSIFLTWFNDQTANSDQQLLLLIVIDNCFHHGRGEKRRGEKRREEGSLDFLKLQFWVCLHFNISILL